MGHQPFETWIFERDELSFDQERDLSSHLHDCERCQSMATALAQVDLMFKSEPMAAPVAGFTLRWKRRVERKSRRRARFYTTVVTALISIGLIATAWLAGSALWDWFLDTADQVAVWIDNIIRFLAQLEVTGRLYTILVENFLGQVPVSVWISVGMLAAVALGLWIFSARKIVFQPS